MEKIKYSHIQCQNCKDVIEVINRNPICNNCNTVLYVKREEKLYYCVFCKNESENPICDCCLINMQEKVLEKTPIKKKKIKKENKKIFYLLFGLIFLIMNWYFTGAFFLFLMFIEIEKNKRGN